MHLLPFVVSSLHLAALVLTLNTVVGVSGMQEARTLGGRTGEQTVAQASPQKWLYLFLVFVSASM